MVLVENYDNCLDSMGKTVIVTITIENEAELDIVQSLRNLDKDYLEQKKKFSKFGTDISKEIEGRQTSLFDKDTEEEIDIPIEKVISIQKTKEEVREKQLKKPLSFNKFKKSDSNTGQKSPMSFNKFKKTENTKTENTDKKPSFNKFNKATAKVDDDGWLNVPDELLDELPFK